MKYSISIADLEKEKDNIKRFWRENFPGWPEKKFEWLYRDNIYGRAFCWLVKRDDNNQIVGSLAIFPKKMLIKGKVFTAGLSGDWGIAPKHRRKGLATKLRKALIQSLHDEHFDFLYGTPNNTSVKISIKAGYNVVGKPERLVKLFNSFNFFKRHLKISFLAKLVSIPADIYLKYSSKEKKISANSPYSYKILGKFDDRFDKFWDSVEKDKFITGEKSKRFLSWRFNDCIWEDFQIFILSQKDSNDISAYLVYRLINNEVQIVDFLCKNYDNIFSELLSQFIHYIRLKKYENITFCYFGNIDIQAKLKSYGFWSFPESRSLVVYTKQEFEYYNKIHNKDNWLFLEADSDV